MKPQPSIRWEFRVAHARTDYQLESLLNAMSQEGWELLQFLSRQTVLFKRKLTMKTVKLRNLALTTLLLLTALLWLPGCSTPKGNEAVPSSVLKIPTPNGNAEVTLPKDQSVEKFTYRREGTNVFVEITGLKSENKEAVVAASYAGIVQAMQRQNDQQWQWMQTYMFSANKAGTYFGLPQTPIPTNAPASK